MGGVADQILGEPLDQEAPDRTPQASNAVAPKPPLGGAPAADTSIPSPPAAPAGSVSRAILGGDGADARLTQSVTEAASKSPDEARRVLSMQMRTGLPADMISRNLPDIEKAAAQADFDPAKFRQTSPVVADWMAEHPVNAAAAKDDVGPLTRIENFVSKTTKDAMDSLVSAVPAPVRAFESGALSATGDIIKGIPALGGALESKLEDSARTVSPRLGDLIDWVHSQHDIAVAKEPAFIRGTVGGGYESSLIDATWQALQSLGERVDIPEKQRTFVTDVSKMGGGFVPYVAGELASAGMATPLMAAGGAGSAARENEKTNIGGMEGEDARNNSIILGATINGLFSRVGLQRVIDKLPPQIQNSMLRWTADKGLTFGEQSAVNASMQVANNAAAKATTDPDRDLGAGVVPTTLTGATTGTIARMILQAAMGPHAAVAKGTQDGLSDMADASDKSKLREQSQQAFESLVGRMKDNGVDSVYVPVEKWTKYFQGQGIDPGKMAADITDNKDAYGDAVATGGDIRIPAEKYAARLAPTDHNQALQGDMRLSPDHLTANEMIELESRRGELEKDFETAAKETQDWKPANTNEQTAFNTIHDDIAGQLQSRFERGTADKYAELFAKAFVTQSLRAGRDPVEDWGRYQVSIDNDVPDVLRARDLTDTELDPMIDRLRTGDIPSEKAVYGKSLLPFLREQGGMADTDGELRAMDVHKKWGLVRKDGLELDHAAMAAYEKGYIDTPDQATLLEAIRDEMSGDNRYSHHNTDTAAETTRLTLQEMEGYLGSKNVDINKSSNAEIKKAIRGPDETETRVLGQPPAGTPDVAFRGEHSDEAKAAVKAALDYAKGDRDIALIHLDDQRAVLGNKVTGDAINALRQASIVRANTKLMQERRGSIEFSAPDPDGKRRFNIKLTKDADLSTFIHETGHFWLERLSELAAAKDATVQIVDDFNSVKKWLESEAGKDFTEDQHEQFARGVESYIMEGRAPTPTLQGVFSRMRAWLTGVYKSLTNLGVTLNDEVRGVMDRLIASDQEIQAAQTAAQYKPLFESAKEAGMTDSEFRKYQGAQDAARQEAVNDLNKKVMEPYTREQKKMYREQRSALREKIRQQVNAMPEQQAIHFLQKGEPLQADGAPPLPEGIKPFKINRGELEDRYGDEFVKRLPRGTTAKDGISADQAADVFGFQSGDEMVQKLVNARPRAKLIEALTDEKMRELHGDPLHDGTMQDLAKAAVHNESRAEVMLRELKTLQDKAEAVGRPREKVTTLQVIKSMAERVIGSKPVQEINPNMYRMAEAKAGRLAFEAASQGRMEDALTAKKQQLINHEMARASEKAKDEIEKTVDYMQRFTTTKMRERLGKAGEDYLGQIDNLLERYSFARISNREVQRRKTLAQWAADQEAAGNETVIPDHVLNEANKTSYKELSYDQLHGVRDTAANIAHLAQIKGRLLANAKLAQIQDAVDSIDSTIRANNKMHTEKLDFAPGYAEKLRRGAAAYIGAHTKLEFLFDRLDGFKPIGPVWHALFHPFVEAENAESVRMRAAAEEMNRLFGTYTRKERMLWHYTKTHVPEVDASFNKASLLAAALNSGNRYNKDALLKGYGWSEDQFKAVLSHLDKRDWDLVQGIWDHLDTYYPDVAALQKRITGVAPKQVQADPVETAHGTYRGGYYPLKFDSRLSYRQMQLDEKNDAQTLYGAHWARIMTQQGHTKERSNSGGKPPLLSLSVLTEHIQNVIHDLTHREALIDATKLVDHATVKDAIESAAGKEMYKQLRPWLRTIAGDKVSLHDGTEEIMQKARAGATLVNMGFKVSTGVYQLSGLAQSVSRLGPKYTALGLKDITAGVPWKQQKQAMEFVFSRSEAMNHRMQNYDRDARAVLAKTSISGVVTDVQHTALMHIGMADMAVSLPTWLGAYRKAMDGAEPTIGKGDEESAIKYADSLVRMTQPSAGAKDLAQIVTGPSYKKIFTMFYSYWSTTANMMLRNTNQLRAGGIKDMPRFAAAMSTLWITQALIGDLMVGRGPDKDEGWGHWAGKHIAEFPLDAFIGVRDIAHYASSLAEGKPFDFEFTPVADAFASIAQAGVGAYHAVTGQAGRKDAKAAVMAAGYWGGLPSRQMWITGSYLHDWMVGKQHPTGFLDALRGLAYGPKH